jgi:hypothetical protein
MLGDTGQKGRGEVEMTPIEGLSETVRLPRLGKIHLGIRKKVKRQSDGKEIEYPEKTDYFVFPADHSDYKELCRVFGEKPKELRVYIPVEDEEQWATQYYKCYDMTHGLVCKGTGATAIRMIDTNTKNIANRDTKQFEMREIPCAGRDCPEYKAKKCGEAMNLRFVLPEIPGLGVWQIDTGSKNSILNINSCAKLIRRAFGRISMIPLKLTLEPAEVKNPETGKKQTVFVLNLRTAVTLAQLADVAREQAKQLLIGPAELEAEYEAQIERDVEDLFGDGRPQQAPAAPPSPPPAPAAPPSQPEAAKAPVAPAATEGEGSTTMTDMDKLIARVKAARKSLRSDKNVLDWLTSGPNAPTLEQIEADPKAEWARIRDILGAAGVEL